MKPKVSLLQFFTIGLPILVFLMFAMIVAIVAFEGGFSDSNNSSSLKFSKDYDIRCVIKPETAQSLGLGKIVRHDYMFRVIEDEDGLKNLVSVKFFEINEKDNYEEVFNAQVPYTETSENLNLSYSYEVYKENNLTRTDTFLKSIDKKNLERYMMVGMEDKAFSVDTNCTGFDKDLVPVIASTRVLESPLNQGNNFSSNQLKNYSLNQESNLTNSQLIALKEEVKKELKAEMNEKKKKDLELQSKLLEYQLEKWKGYSYESNTDNNSSSNTFIESMRKAEQDKINRENERRLYCLERYDKGVYTGTFGADPRCPGRLR